MPLPSWLQSLIDDGPALLDGAWGTQLQARGLAIGEMPDLWNLQHPERVEEVPRAYVEAGSQIVLTNTFRANRIAFADLPEVDKIREINIAGVEISKRACADSARVFASIGPSGKLLAAKAVTEEELRAAFEEQATALAEAGADGLVIETMTDLREMKIAIEAAKPTGLPLVACMVFDSGKQKDRTMTGTTPEEAASALEDYGADIIGANCGYGIEGYVGVCRRMAKASSKPIWIKANAGIPELIDGEAKYTMTAETYASYFEALIEAGASFVGGCCGTAPGFIRALAQTRAGERVPS